MQKILYKLNEIILVIRNIRGDKNYFYRAFGFEYIE